MATDAAVASAVAGPALTTMEVQIPDGLREGESFQVMTPTGPATLQVPPGHKGGMKMAFQTAAAAPVPVAVPQAVPVQTIQRDETAATQTHTPQAVPVASLAVPVAAAVPSVQSIQPVGVPFSQPVQVQVLQPPAVAVTTQLMPNLWGRLPQMHTCQFCGHQGVTHVEFDTGTGTWLFCGGACFIGCVAGCCLLPFCMDEFKDAVHYCPSCRMRVGMKPLLN